jgi:hypothetical protein
MRRLLAALAILISSASSAAQIRPVQNRPLQADPVVRLLSELENALTSGRPEDFRALAPNLADGDAAVFTRATTPAGANAAPPPPGSTSSSTSLSRAAAAAGLRPGCYRWCRSAAPTTTTLRCRHWPNWPPSTAW